MPTRLIQIFLALMVLIAHEPTFATLLDRGRGLVYDDDTNLTWLKDWDYAKTSGYDQDGLMDWNTATTWADTLVFGGFDDFRLPRYQNFEFSHVWYSELHNMSGQGVTNAGPFVIPPHGYGTDGYWIAELYRAGEAFTFTLTGNTSNGQITGLNHAVAVRVGDVPFVSDVPEPETCFMLSVGFVALLLKAGKRSGRATIQTFGIEHMAELELREQRSSR